ncbi:MAG: preprotein translocase subunit SecE [Armatimonadota bacterium]
MVSVKTEGGSTGLLARLRLWWREIMAELRRVVKPTPDETTQMMLVVIGFVLVVGLWFALWDVVLFQITHRIEAWIHGPGR